jgi:hypothetical protein
MLIRASLAHTFVISPSMVNEVRIGFNRNHYLDNIPSYGQNYPADGFAVPGVADNPTVCTSVRLGDTITQRAATETNAHGSGRVPGGVRCQSSRSPRSGGLAF